MNDESSPADWTVVRTCSTIFEAQFLCTVLEGSEIDCYLPDGHMASIRPELAIALGGIRIMVPASEIERARDVLAQADPSGASLDDDV